MVTYSWFLKYLHMKIFRNKKKKIHKQQEIEASTFCVRKPLHSQNTSMSWFDERSRDSGLKVGPEKSIIIFCFNNRISYTGKWCFHNNIFKTTSKVYFHRWFTGSELLNYFPASLFSMINLKTKKIMHPDSSHAHPPFKKKKKSSQLFVLNHQRFFSNKSY